MSWSGSAFAASATYVRVGDVASSGKSSYLSMCTSKIGHENTNNAAFRAALRDLTLMLVYEATRDLAIAEAVSLPIVLIQNTLTRIPIPIPIPDVNPLQGSELVFAPAEPDQDHRGLDFFDSVWGLLDTTPEGRGTDWYPKLAYDGSD